MAFRLRRLEARHGTRRSSHRFRACRLARWRTRPGTAARRASKPRGIRTGRRNVASPDPWANEIREFEPHRAPLLDAVESGSHSRARIEALKEAKDRFAAAPGQTRPDEAGSDPAPRDSAEEPSRRRPERVAALARRARRRSCGDARDEFVAEVRLSWDPTRAPTPPRSVVSHWKCAKMPAKAAGMESAK